jgi:cell division septation protein DedD
MTRTDGEHELVLGNKQLLSAFFVVVILLGVFFTMGYFVGKNTATAGFNAGQGAAQGGTRPDAAGKPLDSGTGAMTGGLPPDITTPVVDPNSPATPLPTTPGPPATLPPPAPKSEPKSETKPDAKKEFPLEAPPAKTESSAQSGGEEMYLQVSAVRRPDADNLAKVLSERGFPALLRESSKPGLYRVMVGPFKTTGEMGRAKADLKAKGFESIVAK